jgi:hypothetical protein
MTRRMTSRRVSVATVGFMLAMTGLSACDIPEEDDTENGHFYCTDANGVVVAEDLCDDPDGGGGGFFFMYMGSSLHAPPAGRSAYPVGHKFPANYPRIQNTTANRTKLGLPATGRVSNGTVKTGVVGKGGAGSAAVKGSGSGSGGGGKSGGGKTGGG